MRRAKIAAALVAVLLLVILSIQNPNPVEFSFLWMTLPVPKIILVVVSGLIGALATLIIQFLLRSGSSSSRRPSSPSEGPSEL
jgi:uncharacterized integral membrane protein